MSQKTLTEIRDELAIDEAQYCYCASTTCSGCEKQTQKVFNLGFNAAQAEMIKRAQVLVNVIIETTNHVQSHDGSYCEDINNKATEALDKWKESLR